MKHALFSLLACLGLAAVHPALCQTAPADPAEPRAYVRRFSIGGTVGILVLPALPSDSLSQVVADNLTIQSSTSSKRYSAGGGFIAQVALSNRWALATGVSMRLTNFSITDVTVEGIDDEDTTADERLYSSASNTTRARLFDIPVLVRRYNKDRFKPGRRIFYEGGAAVRHVRAIHSFRYSTAYDGTETCCDESPMQPAHRWLPGVVAGVGVQFIDEYGIRFVPEVRFTRWLGSNFDALSARSRLNQIEINLSFTF
jgi:hypothetical protein